MSEHKIDSDLAKHKVIKDTFSTVGSDSHKTLSVRVNCLEGTVLFVIVVHIKNFQRRARESGARARSPRIAELREALSHCGAQRGKAVRGISPA